MRLIKYGERYINPETIEWIKGFVYPEDSRIGSEVCFVDGSKVYIPESPKVIAQYAAGNDNIAEIG